MGSGLLLPEEETQDNGHYYLNETAVSQAVIASRYPKAELASVACSADGVIAGEATWLFGGSYCYGFAALRCTHDQLIRDPYNGGINAAEFHYRS